jgi:hypothetical protein
MLGLPDLGIITLEELCFFTRALYRATDFVRLRAKDSRIGRPGGCG